MSALVTTCPQVLFELRGASADGWRGSWSDLCLVAVLGPGCDGSAAQGDWHIGALPEGRALRRELTTSGVTHEAGSRKASGSGCAVSTEMI